MERQKVLFILKTEGKTAMDMDRESYFKGEAYPVNDVADLARRILPGFIRWRDARVALRRSLVETTMGDYKNHSQDIDAEIAELNTQIAELEQIAGK